MLTLHTLASGSSGNATLISDGETHILLDAGISAKRIKTALATLGLLPNDLAGVLITHEHTDHIAGLATLTKQFRIPVYTAAGTARQLCYRIPFLEELIRPVVSGTAFGVGEFQVLPIATSHDAAESLCFRLESGSESAAVVTDLGYVSENVLEGVRGVDILVAETNHDEEWLKSGPYPYPLRRRILGDRGHLSNESGAALIRSAVEAGTRNVILAHLSAENNTPVHAYDVVHDTLERAGIRVGSDVMVAVAPRSELSHPYEKEAARL